MKILSSTLIILVFLGFSCDIDSQSEAQQLITESIQHHDPDNNWNKFKSHVSVNSIVERNGKIDSSSRNIFFDLAANHFEMKYNDKGDEIHYFLNNKECFGEILNNTKLTPAELEEKNINCDRAKMYNNYFRYLIGMPMKLKDPGTIINKEITSKVYKDKAYKVVTVTYEEKVGTYTWLFYFDIQTTELVLTEFSKDGSFQNGETIELNNKVRYQNMLLPGQLKWFVLPDRPFLAEENLSYSKKDPNK